jgi:hypothetical protein
MLLSSSAATPPSAAIAIEVKTSMAQAMMANVLTGEMEGSKSECLFFIVFGLKRLVYPERS